MYAKRKPAKEASDEYISSCLSSFARTQQHHAVSYAEDWSKVADSHASFQRNANETVTDYLNSKVREPPRLLFWKGAKFEATVNTSKYNQSQLMVMVDVPSEETIRQKSPISLMVAPPGVTYIPSSVPLEKQSLLDRKWKEVTVNATGSNFGDGLRVGGFKCMRKQYCLCHVGSSTINKQMGNTIFGMCAIEVTRKCAPWQKEQAVVALSRTQRACDTIIVGDPDWAIDHLWKLLLQPTQWTSYIEHILDELSIK